MKSLLHWAPAALGVYRACESESPMSRVACGIIAGIVGILAGAVATVIEMRVLGVSRPRTFWIVFFAVGGAIFGFADRLGIVSPPYTPPPMDLRGSAEADEQQRKDPERT